MKLKIVETMRFCLGNVKDIQVVIRVGTAYPENLVSLRMCVATVVERRALLLAPGSQVAEWAFNLYEALDIETFGKSGCVEGITLHDASGVWLEVLP